MKGKVFNAQEVQAILDGSKVMFREVIKGAELEVFHPAIHSWAQSPHDHKFYAKAKNDEVKQQYVTTFPFHGIKCPYQVGQKIFVKESWCNGAFYLPGEQTLLYKADLVVREGSYKRLKELTWKPARRTQEEHSRLTLQIKSIGVERLGDISQEDCLSEGIELDYQQCELTRFKTLWNATHKKPEEKFEASPWVWSIQFQVVK